MKPRKSFSNTMLRPLLGDLLAFGFTTGHYEPAKSGESIALAWQSTGASIARAMQHEEEARRKDAARRGHSRA